VVVALGHRQVAREAAVGEIAAREAAVVVVHGCLQLLGLTWNVVL
jgi:ssRNA-specific RNase YbeY (16S rRNA maturation enzyme)